MRKRDSQQMASRWLAAIWWIAGAAWAAFIAWDAHGWTDKAVVFLGVLGAWVFCTWFGVAATREALGRRPEPRDEAQAVEIERLREALARAAYVADHLLEQVPEFTGVIGPEGQHEDDYIAGQIHEEIQSWRDLALPEPVEVQAGAWKDEL